MSGFAGNGPSGAGRAARFQFNATAGQVTFSGVDQNGLTLSYVPNYVEVSVNGIWLPPSDYTAADGSSIVLPNGCSATDVVYVYALSTFSAANTYDKAQNGADILDKAAFRTNATIPAVGQCFLKLSGANIALQPRGGNLLTINGVNCAIPAAGLSLAPTGLTAGTLYYIYAVATNGVVTSLEASATSHSPSATAGNVGVEIKTGDDTRTLVGMARPTTGPAWADTAAQRFVRSWFNDSGVENLGTVFATRGATSSVVPTYVELQSGNRIEMLLWASERWTLEATGSANNATSPAACYTAIGVDGTTPEDGRIYANSVSSGSIAFCAKALKISLSEGYHYGTILGCVSSSGGQWAAASDFGGCVIGGFSRRN